jgi:aspartyl-tRNA synthetase
MSFVTQEDILNTFEAMIKHVFKAVKNIDIAEPVQRMTWMDAMHNYGNDKPDIRFDMQLKHLNDLVKNKGFKVFDDAELILGIVASGCSEYTRKQTDELTEWVKRPQVGMSGLAFIKCNTDGTYKSSIDKFYTTEQLQTIAQYCGAAAGDLILLLSGTHDKTLKATSDLRMHLAESLGLRKPDEYKLLWVTDFPLFEYDEGGNRWVARHHPFTSPKPGDIDTMVNNNPSISNPAQYLQHPYATIKANAYDMVLNGNEIGGGSIRIHNKDLQQKMFAALGMDEHEANEKFGFLLGAFEYGAPPHGGIAFGFDRLCALLGGSESIRDFIAFPKNNKGRDVMIEAPSQIDVAQKQELGLK